MCELRFELKLRTPTLQKKDQIWKESSLDLGKEPNLGRRHGVLLRKEELELEVST